MPITNRELEVLVEVAKGQTNEKAGHNLGIAARTVRKHMYSIMIKLDCHNRTDAVVRAFAEGWITFEVSPNGTG